MKYLILGSGSFAGQTLFSHLLNLGKTVCGINRSHPLSSTMWPWLTHIDLSGIWYTYNIVDDIESIIDFFEDFRPNIVIDFMGQGMVAQSWDDPALWFHTNITQKSKLLKHLSSSDYLEQYIRASTPEVYGSSLDFKHPDSSFAPTTPYAVSHSSIDSYIRCLGRSYGFPYKIGRFANFYGVGQQLYRVIPRMILSCFTSSKFVLDGGGTSLRSFINSEDICQAFDLLTTKSNIYSEYHFAGNEEISITDLIDKICDLCGVNRSSIVQVGPERIGKDACYRLDCTQSSLDLGWSPSISLDEGITSMIKWIRPNIASLSTQTWSYVHKR